MLRARCAPPDRRPVRCRARSGPRVHPCTGCSSRTIRPTRAVPTPRRYTSGISACRFPFPQWLAAKPPDRPEGASASLPPLRPRCRLARFEQRRGRPKMLVEMVGLRRPAPRDAGKATPPNAKRLMSTPSSSAASEPDWPAGLYRVLKSAEVRLVSYVPDAGHARLIQLFGRDPDVHSVALTTEEEGVALAVGAWLGGERSVLLVQ